MIGSLKRKAQKKLVTPVLIAGLLKSDKYSLRTTGTALKSHRDNKLTRDELWWIEAIEQIRSDLSSSTERIGVPDYGAGSPNDTRSGESMYAGKLTTEIIGEACRNYSKPRIWATLLFHLIRRHKPEVCVELGTCLGISAAYQAAALELNGSGRLLTLEGAPSFAEVAGRTLRSLGLCHRVEVVVGRFDDTLETILSGTAKIDYVFIDGHHDEQATIRYFERFVPHLADQALIVFDDIAWSPGMRSAWQRISRDTRIDVSFNFSNIGVCLKGVGVKSNYEMVVV
jgi:predicted O-methyltransferase YrrM